MAFVYGGHEDYEDDFGGYLEDEDYDYGEFDCG